MTNDKPLVAIVGRPNVGKSTLFNRLIGSRRAITSEVPGTTRDRLYADAVWRKQPFTFIDTGGITNTASATGSPPSLREAVNDQVAEAIAEADGLLFVVDVMSGLTGEDRRVATMLRQRGKTVILVANKTDTVSKEKLILDFWELGLGQPQAVSAYHGRGVGDLLDELVSRLRGRAVSPIASPAMPRVAIIGRPNVGKSTLLNWLVGSRRVITSDEPGTTRDVATVVTDSPAGPLTILDTAGVTRRGKARRGIAKYSLLRTIRAINEADVVCLLLDGAEGPTGQDARISAYVLEAGKALVLVVNKWDLVAKSADVQESFFASLHKRFSFLPHPPVVFLSAKTGSKVDRLSRAIYDVWKIAATKIPTPELNRVAESVALSPGKTGRRPPKLYYVVQVGVRPPTFRCFVNSTLAWTEPRRRQLINVLREHYGLVGTPIRLQFRAKKPSTLKEP